MTISIIIRPRESMTWQKFCSVTSPKSIALDGMVTDGPQWDEATLRANFDHHSGVVREATMSTAMQVMFAIKGGLMERLGGFANVYINDPDQDTALATWLLMYYSRFDGIQSHPNINRLLALNDRLDITGGAYPMRLDDEVLEMHAWVFEPYSELRISGALATADAVVMRNCLDAVHARLDKVLMGQHGLRKIRHEAVVLYDSKFGYKVIDEIGGNEGRYELYSKGMNAFVSIVARPSYGRYVYSIGRRSRYVDFPLHELYDALNSAEGCGSVDRWGGSDIIGGSPRESGSGLDWEMVRNVVEGRLAKLKGDQTSVDTKRG